MCPMMLPTAAFAAENDATSSAPSSVEQAQPADQGTGPSNDTLATQPEAADNTADATDSEEKSAPATTTEKAEATEGKATTPTAETGEESNEAAVAEVNGKTYSSLQDAIAAAPRKATVKLLDWLTFFVFPLTGCLRQPSGGLAFCLSESSVKSKKELSFLRKCMDFLEFEIDIYFQGAELARGFQYGVGVAGKTCDGFGNDLAEMAVLGVL